MDKKYTEAKSRMNHHIDVMNGNLTMMMDGLKGLHEALGDFKDEFDMFIDFASENYSDHEKRISALEKKAP